MAGQDPRRTLCLSRPDAAGDVFQGFEVALLHTHRCGSAEDKKGVAGLDSPVGLGLVLSSPSCPCCPLKNVSIGEGASACSSTVEPTHRLSSGVYSVGIGGKKRK